MKPHLNPPSSPATWVLTILLAGVLTGTQHHAVAQSQPSSQRQQQQLSQQRQPSAQQQQQSSQQMSQPQGDVKVSSMAISGGEGEEALRVERKDPAQIRAGQPFAYQIVVTNTSDNPVRQVVVREKNPKDMRIDQAQPQRSEESSPTENVWQLETINPGESKTITVNATPPAAGQMQACLTVDFKPTLCSQFQVVKPDLKLERQAVDQQGQPREQFLACEDIFLQYRLTNVGSGETQEAQITEELNEMLQTKEGEKAVSLTVAPLEAGETYEQQIPLHVAAQQTGRYEGFATAKTGPLTARSPQDPIEIVNPELNLTVQGPQREFIDRAVTYHIRVENTGNGPALNTRVAMQLPDSAQRISVSGQDIQREGNEFIIGRIDPGASREFSVNFNVTEPTTISTQATAQAYCAQEQQAKMSTQIAGIPAIRLEVIDLQDPVQVGENTTYEIRIKNQGSAKDLNVQVQGQLPASLQFVDARGDTSVENQGQQLQFGKIDELAPGEMISWYIQAKANEAGKAIFKIQMTSDASKRPVNEEEPTTLY